MATLSVADEGRGVAPEELPNLFRKYAGRAPGAGSSGEALDGAGFDTMATGNFRDLARILDAERPARVLLDLVLPGSDGIELMAQAPGARRAAGHLHLRLRPRAPRRSRGSSTPAPTTTWSSRSLGDRTDGAGARGAAAAGRPGGSITMSSSGIVDALRNEDQIVAIEAIEGAAAPTARRGSRKAVKAVGRRKRTMTEEQRRAVAERMRKYWLHDGRKRPRGTDRSSDANCALRSHPTRGGGLRVGGSGSRDRPRLCGGLPDGRQGTDRAPGPRYSERPTALSAPAVASSTLPAQAGIGEWGQVVE